MKGDTALKTKVTFQLNAPEASEVRIAGCFTEWEKAARPLKRQKKGLWKTTLSLPPGTYHYRFIVDGRWQDDPACATRETNPFGSEDCVLIVA